MTEEIWIRPYVANHGRCKSFLRGVCECDVCGNQRLCLGFDSSDEEYGPTFVCQACTAHFFNADTSAERTRLIRREGYEAGLAAAESLVRAEGCSNCCDFLGNLIAKLRVEEWDNT